MRGRSQMVARRRLKGRIKGGMGEMLLVVVVVLRLLGGGTTIRRQLLRVGGKEIGRRERVVLYADVVVEADGRPQGDEILTYRRINEHSLVGKRQRWMGVETAGLSTGLATGGGAR